jgi:transposase
VIDQWMQRQLVIARQDIAMAEDRRRRAYVAQLTLVVTAKQMGMTVPEIAKTLGLSKPTIYNMLTSYKRRAAIYFPVDYERPTDDR